jgi:hypothetical protein
VFPSELQKTTSSFEPLGLVSDPSLFVIFLHMLYIFDDKFYKFLCYPTPILNSCSQSWDWACLQNKTFDFGDVTVFDLPF